MSESEQKIDKIAGLIARDMNKAKYKTPEMIAVGIIYYARKLGYEDEFVSDNLNRISEIVIKRLNNGF